MDLWQKLASMAVGAALLLGCMTRAHANLGPERYARSHDTRTVWRPVPAKDRAQAERLIDGAARDLEEAALQSGFTSNSRVLYLLRSAQDQLIRAMGPHHSSLRVTFPSSGARAFRSETANALLN
jgi:hypothetical protein